MPQVYDPDVTHEPPQALLAQALAATANAIFISDRTGRITGDRLLTAVADRLRAGVRQTDTVARIGGDEFAILVTELPDLEVATVLADKLLETVSHPFLLTGQKIVIGASIGIAIYPCDGDDPETLLIHADKAMYQAKRRGGNAYDLYHIDAGSDTYR
jgi:diguanylate cyclase (GGDEF)-like protein